MSGISGLGERNPLTHEGVPLSQNPHFPTTDGTCKEITDNIKDSCTVNKFKNEYDEGQGGCN